MVANGPRPEEAFGLTWDDVDLKGGKVDISRVLKWNRRGGGWRLRDSAKTDAGTRTLGLDPNVLALLKEHRLRQMQERIRAGRAYQKHGLVFCTETGGPLHPSNVTNRHLRPVLEAAGITRAGAKKLSLYSLRHTYATLSLLAGEKEYEVSKNLGHRSVAFTISTYCHLVEAVRAKASGKLGRMIFSKKRAKGR